MKKKTLFAAIALIAMVFAFVSCSDDASTKAANKVGSISIGGEAKAIGTTVEYSSEVENLYWCYTAAKDDDGYTTGATGTTLTPVTGTACTGLSGKSLDSNGFSYGLWNINLYGFASADDATSADNAKYKATLTDFLVNADKNYATVDIETGAGAETTIVFGDIYFSSSNFTADSVFSLAITDSASGNTVSVNNTKWTSGDFTEGYKAEAEKVTFKGITMASGYTAVGSHEMVFTLTQNLKGTGNTTITAANYTLNFDVAAGTKTTISGDMNRNDKTGEIIINGVQSVAETTLYKVIPVTSDSSTNKATVKTKTVISVGDLSVTYPSTAVIVPGTDGLVNVGTDNAMSDGTVGFDYIDDTLPASISIKEAHNTANYQLTLSAPTANEGTVVNNTYLTISKNIGKGLSLIDVYHESAKMTKLSALAESDSTTGVVSDISADSYYYDSTTGVITLYVKHASNFYIVTKSYVAEIGTTKYTTLADAVTAAQSGDTIKMLANVDLTATQAIDGKDIKIDLNNFSIAGNKARALQVKSGELSLTGTGTISSDIETVSSSVIRVGDDTSTGTAELVVGKNVTISSATCYGVTVFGTTTEKVTVNGTISTTAPVNVDYDGCAIATSGTDTKASTIIINDGASLTTTNTNAVYMPSGNLTVNGGTITGYTGIYIKAGSSTIKGGTITGNGAKETYNYYGNGGKRTGDAIVVDNCGYPATSVPKVSITGGTFTSTKANAVGSYATSTETQTYEPITGFICGGAFSTDPNAYVADGYYGFKDATTGKWTVRKLTEDDYVAQNINTGVNYMTLNDAVSAATDSCTIKLLKDCELPDAQVKTPISFTLELNNKVLTINNELNFGYDASYNKHAVNETIQNGKIVFKATGKQYGTSPSYLRFENGSKGTFNNVIFEYSNSTDDDAARVIQTYATNEKGENIINTYNFDSCTFISAAVTFEGSSGSRNNYRVGFNNCVFTAKNMYNGSSCILIDDYDYGSLTVSNTEFYISGTNNSGYCVNIDTYLGYTGGVKFNATFNNVTMNTSGEVQPYTYRFLNYNGVYSDNAEITTTGTNVFKHNNETVECAIKEFNKTSRNVVWVENAAAFEKCYPEWVKCVQDKPTGYTAGTYYLAGNNGYYFVMGIGYQIVSDAEITKDAQGNATQVKAGANTYSTIDTTDISTGLGESDNPEVMIYKLSR